MRNWNKKSSQGEISPLDIGGRKTLDQNNCLYYRQLIYKLPF